MELVSGVFVKWRGYSTLREKKSGVRKVGGSSVKLCPVVVALC